MHWSMNLSVPYLGEIWGNRSPFPASLWVSFVLCRVGIDSPKIPPEAKKKGLGDYLSPCLIWLGDVDSNHG